MGLTCESVMPSGRLRAKIEVMVRILSICLIIVAVSVGGGVGLSIAHETYVTRTSSLQPSTPTPLPFVAPASPAFETAKPAAATVLQARPLESALSVTPNAAIVPAAVDLQAADGVPAMMVLRPKARPLRGQQVGAAVVDERAVPRASRSGLLQGGIFTNQRTVPPTAPVRSDPGSSVATLEFATPPNPGYLIGVYR